MVILDAAHAMPPRIFPIPPRSGLVMLIYGVDPGRIHIEPGPAQVFTKPGRAVIKELAERKAIQDALTESEQRFHTIFDSVNDAIFVHDLKTGAILDVNQRMCEMYGYTRQEALQLSIEDLSQGEPPYYPAGCPGLVPQNSPGRFTSGRVVCQR